MIRCAPRPRQFAALLALGLMGLARPAAAAPQVVVSIAPVHSLVAAIMQGVGTPKLLIPASASPHVYTLRPSDAQALAAADIVFRVGPELEIFLNKPLAALVHGSVVDLMADPGMIVRDVAVGRDDATGREGGPDHSVDPHIWLSLRNAHRIATVAAQTLSARDPQNASAYSANLARVNRRLDALQHELEALLAPVSKVPYVVMHEAYRYLEAEFALRHVAAITLSPERQPGAQRLYAIRNLLAAQDVRCVFAEPQFPASLGHTVVDGINARLAILDPVGVDIAPGPELYFTLMKNIGRSLAECLSAAWPP